MRPLSLCRWVFAYTCVVQVIVKRQRDMWSWVHIKAHRRVFHEYVKLYKLKLSGGFTALHLTAIEVSLLLLTVMKLTLRMIRSIRFLRHP